MTNRARRRCAIIALGIFMAACVPVHAAAKAFDRQEWLADLQQVKVAFATKYANLQWAQIDSAHRLSDLLDQTRDRIKQATSDADARAAFDRLTQRLGDGHVHFDWPQAADPATRPSDALAPCRAFDAARAALPLMTHA